MFRRFNLRLSIGYQNGLINNIARLNDYFKKSLYFIFDALFKQWEVQYIFMAFLLGRATILNELSPFAIPFFAVLYHIKKDRLLFIFLSLLLGSNMVGLDQTFSMFWGTIIYLMLQKILEKAKKNELNYSPFLVAIGIALPKIVHQFLNEVLNTTSFVMTITEALLGFVLTLIFIQALPIIIYKRNMVFSLNQEEVIALTIIMASVMTGTIGWNVYGYSVEHIFSRYFILLFALVGGGAVGSSIGVVTGLILSLSNPDAIYQISLLAFSGLLAGLLKQANKIGVAVGLLLGTTILSIYIGSQADIWKSLNESAIAILLLLFTPKGFIREIAKFIPGTNEYHNQYQQYVSKIRDVTSQKIEQFSTMFSHLASSFKEISTKPLLDQNEQIDHFVSQVSDKQCKTCWKKSTCWNEEFFKTYRLITELMTVIETREELTKKDIPRDWAGHCVKSDQVAFQLVDIYKSYSEHLYWKSQLEESRLLVSHQLLGVSKVMKDIAEEIQKEGKELSFQEQQIQYSLEKLGLSVRQVNVLNLDEGNVEIEITQPSCRETDECIKVVAPLLSEVIGENIIVKKKECNFGKDGTCKMCLNSAKTYELETGFASAAKGGKWLSGDSFSTIEIGKGKLAVALSDGMGNGERARKESETTLNLLKQLLHSGIDETISIKTINSVLLLRSPEEIFSTIDLAIVDLFSGHTKFIKVGSSPSFIKRKDNVEVISANNLPIGIIQDIDVDVKEYTLVPGDILVMVTDGIYDSPKHTTNKELWMKRLIQEIVTDDPQEFADLLIEKVIRAGQGDILDDMTIVVSKMDEYKPEWATIKIPGISRIEREKAIN